MRECALEHMSAAPAMSMTAGTVLLKITGRRLIIDEMEKTLEVDL